MPVLRVLAVTSGFGVSCSMTERVYRAYSHDVAAAMLVYQENPVGVELFPYVNAFFYSNEFAQMLATSACKESTVR